MRESSVTRSPSPIRSLDLPPLSFFFQGFMLAKSGLLRAASTSHHHHFHKSSRCFPTSVSEVLKFSITLHLIPQGPKGLGLRPHATLVSPPPLWLPLRVLVHLPPPSPPSLYLSPMAAFWWGDARRRCLERDLFIVRLMLTFSSGG